MPTDAPPLPAVLRLPPYRSMLPTGPRGRMLGLDPAVAVAVDDLPPPLAEMLDELHAPAERERLVGGAVERGAEAAAAEALLRALVDAGALVDAAQVERSVRARAAACAVVVGRGPLAVGVVTGLVHAGIGTVHTDTGGCVGVADLGTGYQDADRGHDRLAATRAAVRRLFPSAGTTPPPLRLVPDLVVLADTTPEPARITTLHVERVAHLAARLRDGVGIVGPLVLPGRSTCLTCLELHRGARDPGWPAVAAQLVGQAGRADPACVAATAALATAQALVALDGPTHRAPPPPTLDATLELDLVAGTVVRRGWMPLPECRCGAALAHGRSGGGPRHGRATSAAPGGGDTIRE